MKIVVFATWLIIFNFMFAWVSALGIVETEHDNFLSDEINRDTFENQFSDEGGVIGFLGGIVELGNYIATAVKVFVWITYNTTMGFPNMLANPPFMFPSVVTSLIVVLQLVVYAFGMASFLRGFNAEG